MRHGPFYFEIKDVMTQFVAAFNDIIIKRYDKERVPRKQMRVRYVYSPKQRVIHDLTNKAKHITLPVVAVNITGVSRDETRVFNKLEGAWHTGAENRRNSTTDPEALNSYHVPQPVPIDISVSMSILARYQSDIEQIISNFVPYTDPYIVISWKQPGNFTNKEQEIRSEVMWDGNLNINYPDQLSPTEPYRLSCDTNFTIKSWLFKKPQQPKQHITKITTSMTIPDEDVLDFHMPVYNDETEFSYMQSIGPALTGAPTITHVLDTSDPHIKEVWGYNFNNITSVYVSGSDINTLSGVAVNLFSPDTSLSNEYPEFTGVEIDHTPINENKISVNVSGLSGYSESVDLILTTIAGSSTSITSHLHGKGLDLPG